MHAVILAAVLLAASPVVEPGAFTEEQQERLSATLVELGATPSVQESAELREHVMRDGLDMAERVAFFTAFFSEHPLTGYHLLNLDAHIRYGTANADRMARFSGTFAATALSLYWLHAPASGEIDTLVLPFFEQLYNTSDENVRGAVARGISDALRANPLPLASHLLVETVTEPGAITAAMQTCVSLGVFANKGDVETWMDIPPHAIDVFQSTGVWLFDGGLLTPPHLDSIKSLMKGTPERLHGISAIFVPEAVSLHGGPPNLRLPGATLHAPVINMDILRAAPAMGLTSYAPVPEFTARLLEQLAYVIQTLQFRNRPDLAYRVGMFMNAAANPATTSLRGFVPDEMLFQGPESVFLSLLCLWLTRSEAALDTAFTLADQQVQEPLHALLLVADLFSDGGDTTRLFRTNPAGVLSSSETALRRAHISPSYSYVNGIAVGGQLRFVGDGEGMF